MIYRDTLMRLADDGAKGWASWEEKLIKACCHWVAAAESLSTPEKITFAPWLDIYYGFGDTVSYIPVSFKLPRVIRFNTLAGLSSLPLAQIISTARAEICTYLTI